MTAPLKNHSKLVVEGLLLKVILTHKPILGILVEQPTRYYELTGGRTDGFVMLGDLVGASEGDHLPGEGGKGDEVEVLGAALEEV